MQDRMCVCNVCLDVFLDQDRRREMMTMSRIHECMQVQHSGGGVSVMGLCSAQWTMGLVYVLSFGGKLVIKERDLFGPIGEKHI